MAKKYFVSLAVKRPVNFEITVEAENEQEALNKAIDAFDDSSDGEITPPDEYVGDDELDLGLKDGEEPTPDTAGVFIEKQED